MKNPYVLYHSRKNALFHGPSLTIVCQWGNFGALLPPRGTTYTPLRGYVLAQLDNLFICGDLHVFYEILARSYDSSKLAAMRCLWDFSAVFFAQCTNIVRPIAYKSHSTPFLNRPLDLTPVSWVCDKRCRRSSAPKFVRKKKNNNNNSTQHNTSDALPSASTTN